jgi:hypothetical protein
MDLIDSIYLADVTAGIAAVVEYVELNVPVGTIVLHIHRRLR